MSCDNEVTTKKPIGSWTITETSSSTSVSESGSTDTFTVVLATRVPDGNVIVDISSSDTGEVTVSPSSLTFSSDNYTTAQTVTVTGINDNLDDGNITSTITLTFNDSQSADESYEALADKTISVTTTDDDTVGITVTETNGSTAPMESKTDTLDITLSSEPVADVTISITSSDIGEITVTPNSMTFSSGNFSTAQTVTLTAVQDALVDNNQNSIITFSVTSSVDASYASLADKTFTSTATDSLLVEEVNEIALGDTHSCYVDNDVNKTLYCWGDDNCDSAGASCTGPITIDGTSNDNTTGVPVLNGLQSVQSLAISQNLSCALYDNNSAYCWGWNESGSLGSTAGQLLDGSNTYAAYSLGVGAKHGCALLDNTTPACWGYGSYGQLGEGGTSWATNRVAYAGVDNVTQLTGGTYFSCALINDGTVKCWGKNTNGQIGDGTTTQRNSPTTVSGLSNVTKVAAGANHVCALISDGTIKCWGRGDGGKLGNGADSDSSSPVTVSGITTATDVDVSDLVACALLNDNSVTCWGGNGNGQLGNGTTGGSSNTPVAVSNLTSVSKVATGFTHACAIRSDNTVWCWGKNAAGQLGDNSTTDRNTPVQVIGF